MKAPPEAVNLALLRRLCGQRQTGDASPHLEKQIGPGHWRKLYLRSRPETWVYKATRLSFAKDPQPPPRLARALSKESMHCLYLQREDLMRQLLARALCGNSQALSLLLSTARGCISALQDLEDFQLANLRAKATASADWPVLLSLNPQQIKLAKDRLLRLEVGTKATTPRRPKQRLDPQNFWTRLAFDALQACIGNKMLVPALQEHCVGAPSQRVRRKIWNTLAPATVYYCTACDWIVIADWEKKCLKLSEPITDDNFRPWWNAVKLCVLEHWWNCHNDNIPDYDTALKHIGQQDQLEWRRRNLAIDRVEQALRSLVGLQ